MYQVQKAVFEGGAASWIPMMNRLLLSYPSPLYEDILQTGVAI